MNFYKKYQTTKWTLQILLILNVFFVLFGFTALFRYLDTHQPTALELAIVGLGTFVVGILGPAYLVYRIQRTAKEMRQRTEEKIAQLVGVWMDNSKHFEGEGYENPLFWANLILSLGETLIKDIDHPATALFTEISPMLRKEIRSRLHEHGHKAHRNGTTKAV